MSGTPYFQHSQTQPYTFNQQFTPQQIQQQQQQQSQQQQQLQQSQQQSNNNNNLSYLANLQTQLRNSGAVSSELLRQHAVNNGSMGLNGSNKLPVGVGASILGNSTNGNSNWGGMDLIGVQQQQQQQHQQQQQQIQIANNAANAAASVLVRPKRRLSTPPAVSSNEDQEDSPQLVDEKPKGKRGRKKKVTPDGVESDDEEDNENGSRKKGSLTANEKRKLQNRAAQRAFRERKEKRVTDLEDRISAGLSQVEFYRSMALTLQQENAALRKGEKVPISTFKMPPLLEHHDSPQDGANSSTSEHLSPPQRHVSPDVKPFKQLRTSSRRVSESLPPPPPPLSLNTISIAQLPTYSYAHTTEPRTATSEATINSTLTLARTPISMERGAQTPDDGFRTYNSRSSQQQFNAQIAERQQQQSFTLASPYPVSASRPDLDADTNFDFDAPFDFSTSIPPLFQDLYDQAFPSPAVQQHGPLHSAVAGSSISTDSPQYFSGATTTVSTDASEIDCEEEAPPLKDGKLPCATCDFSIVSCELPTPWRPPTIADNNKETFWLSQQAWSKLCSHPMFGVFETGDVDELCLELRDKAKCNLTGEIVISKADVCAVFRSIPARAMAKRVKK